MTAPDIPALNDHAQQLGLGRCVGGFLRDGRYVIAIYGPHGEPWTTTDPEAARARLDRIAETRGDR